MSMLKYILSLQFVFILSTAHAQTGWKSPAEAMQWLNSKIATVTQDGKTYRQSLDANLALSSGCELKMSMEEAGVMGVFSNYQFYVEHLNYNTMTAAVSGKTLTLDIGTQNNLKLIKEIKNGVTAGFTNKIQLYFDDLQIARNAIDAFKYIRSGLPPTAPYFESKQEAYVWLNTHVTKAVFGATEIEQTLTVFQEQNNKFVLGVTEKNAKGESKKEYEFYLPDFNASQVRVNATSTRLEIAFMSTGDIKPVKYFLNGEQQNYTHKFEIYTDDAQKAFAIRAAFIYLITGKQEIPEQQANPGLGQNIKNLFEKKGDKPSDSASAAAGFQTYRYETDYGAKCPEPEFSERPYILLSGDRLQALERADATTDGKFTGVNVEMFFTAFSPKSVSRYVLGSLPKFIIKINNGQDPAEIVYMVRAETTGDRRRFIASKNSIYGKAKDISEVFVEISFRKLKEGIYEIILPQNLKYGEYAFMPISSVDAPKGTKIKISCFGVDKLPE